MSMKLKQWGSLLLFYGIVALVLPALTGLQLRIFNLFGENSTKVAWACVGAGLVIWLAGLVFGAGAADPAPQSSPPSPPPRPQPDASRDDRQPAACPKCGAALSPGDRFCEGCGEPVIATATAAATPPALPSAAESSVPAPKSGGRSKKGCLVVLLIVAGAAAWIFYGGSMGTYTAPSRSEPSMPQRMAGTLTEFPVDPASTNRLDPGNIITQSFEPAVAGSSTPAVAAQPASFPPGINTSTIPQVATNMTSATYSAPASAATVNVHVLQTPNPGVAGQLAQGVASTAGGQLQGTRLQSPQGQTYEGWSVRTATILVYILTNLSAGNVVIIYTPNAAGFDAAQRLASSVGNGRGLRDYPQIMGTLGALPAYPPPGYALGNMNNFTGGELTSSINQALTGVDPQVVQALDQVLRVVRVLIPARGTVAQYRNRQRQEKNLLIGDYGSPRAAFAAYRLLSWTFGFAMKKTNTAGFDALSYSDGSGKVMVFQKGPFIGVTMIPQAAPDSELADFARSVQF